MTAPTTITIAADDDVSGKPDSSTNMPDIGGIYHSRNFSRPRRSRSNTHGSHDRRSDHLDVEDEDDWLRDDGRKKQVFKGAQLLWYHNSYCSLGDTV